MDAFSLEMRRRKAKRLWMLLAAIVPLCILGGEVGFGILHANGAAWVRPFLTVAAGLVMAMFVGRRFWLNRWKGPSPPDHETGEAIARNAFRYLYLAWGVATVWALLGLGLLLAGSVPRRLPYVFEGIAAFYFLVYFPRRSFFGVLLWTKF